MFFGGGVIRETVVKNIYIFILGVAVQVFRGAVAKNIYCLKWRAERMPPPNPPAPSPPDPAHLQQARADRAEQEAKERNNKR